MEMLLEERTVDVVESFKEPKERLEDIIREFDEKIRTKFSGAYSISIKSDYLGTTEIRYEFKNSTGDGTFATKAPTIEIQDTISIPPLIFTDLA